MSDDRLTREELEELERLEKEASPTPWIETSAVESQPSVCASVDGVTCEWCIALAGELDDKNKWTDETLRRWRADAKLIAGMRNALPTLLSELRRLREENARMQRAYRMGRTFLTLARGIPELERLIGHLDATGGYFSSIEFTNADPVTIEGRAVAILCALETGVEMTDEEIEKL